MTTYDAIRLDEIRQRAARLRVARTPDDDLEMLLDGYDGENVHTIRYLEGRLRRLEDDMASTESDLDTAEERLHHADARIVELEDKIESATVLWEDDDTVGLSKLLEGWRSRS